MNTDKARAKMQQAYAIAMEDNADDVQSAAINTLFVIGSAAIEFLATAQLPPARDIIRASDPEVMPPVDG